MKKIIKEANFFLNTFGVFKKRRKNKITDREPNYISYSKWDGSISSQYWYTHKGVYRLSDHWESVASCFWILEDKGKMIDNPDKQKHLGYCLWKDFLEIKEYFTGDINEIPLEERKEHKKLYPNLPKRIIGKNILIYEDKEVFIDRVNTDYDEDYITVIEGSNIKKIYNLIENSKEETREERNIRGIRAMFNIPKTSDIVPLSEEYCKVWQDVFVLCESGVEEGYIKKIEKNKYSTIEMWVEISVNGWLCSFTTDGKNQSSGNYSRVFVEILKKMKTNISDF